MCFLSSFYFFVLIQKSKKNQNKINSLCSNSILFLTRLQIKITKMKKADLSSNVTADQIEITLKQLFYLRPLISV